MLKIYFRHPAGIVSDQHRRAGDVVKTAVFDPELIGIVRINGNGGGHVAEFIVNQGEAGFVFPDGRFPLPVEAGVDQRELPCWRGFAGHDAKLPPMEVEVFRFVRHLMDTGESGTDGEVYVAEKGMLCGMKANSNGTGITRSDFKVNVADGRVEGTRVGVRDVVLRGWDNSARCWGRMVSKTRRACALGPGPGACKKEHVGYPVLIPRRVF